MSTARSSVEPRRRAASAALAALTSRRSDHQLLGVRCARSHHVAWLFDTEAGIVYATVTGPHAHGSRDRVDTAHHGGRRGTEYADLLDAGPHADDELPAWCECGPRTISRTALVHALDADQRVLRVS